MIRIPVVNVRAPRYASAYRPVYAQVPPRPMIRNASPALGSQPHPALGAFAASEIPLSIMLITAGAAGFYIAGILPEPATTIVRAVGIGAVGYGVYNMFSAPEQQKVEKTASTAQAPQKTPSPTAFQLVRGNFITPNNGEKPPENFWSRSFDSQIVWYNASPENINFTYEVFANIYGNGVPVEGQNFIQKSLYTGTITLAPGQDSGPLTITIPIVQPPKPGLTGSGLPAPKFNMDIQLRKFDSQGNPVPTGNAIKVGPFDWQGPY